MPMGTPRPGCASPDTKLAREATELVRDSATDLVYDHSRRVFWWGSLQGRNRGLSFDPELLYIGAMFHDLGLNEEFRGSGRRFEGHHWPTPSCKTCAPPSPPGEISDAKAWCMRGVALLLIQHGTA